MWSEARKRAECLAHLRAGRGMPDNSQGVIVLPVERRLKRTSRLPAAAICGIGAEAAQVDLCLSDV